MVDLIQVGPNEVETTGLESFGLNYDTYRGASDAFFEGGAEDLGLAQEALLIKAYDWLVEYVDHLSYADRGYMFSPKVLSLAVFGLGIDIEDLIAVDSLMRESFDRGSLDLIKPNYANLARWWIGLNITSIHTTLNNALEEPDRKDRGIIEENFNYINNLFNGSDTNINGIDLTIIADVCKRMGYSADQKRNDYYERYLKAIQLALFVLNSENDDARA